jgi:hypothetical protein
MKIKVKKIKAKSSCSSNDWQKTCSAKVSIMNKFRLIIGFLLASLLASLMARQAYSHVVLETIDSTPCYVSGSCLQVPVVLKSGAVIEVAYEVQIVHGAPLEIQFIQGSNITVLKGNIPELSGSGSALVKLPSIECNSCSLRVTGELYSSTASIVLTESGFLNFDPNDVTAPNGVTQVGSAQNDKRIELSWLNPETDFYRTIIVRSTAILQGAPVSGTEYVVGDIIGNGEIIFIGANEELTVRDLLPNTQYFFAVYAIDQNLNISNSTLYSAMTTNIGNTAPYVYLQSLQGANLSTAIKTSSGPVIIQATISDDDALDTFTLDWSNSDNRLIDDDAAEDVFTFNPFSLAAGNYKVELTVRDNGNPEFATTSTLNLTVSESAAMPNPTPMPSTSSGGGGGSNDWKNLFALAAILVIYLRIRKAKGFTS